MRLPELQHNRCQGTVPRQSEPETVDAHRVASSLEKKKNGLLVHLDAAASVGSVLRHQQRFLPSFLRWPSHSSE